jgi:hypothetical protein
MSDTGKASEPKKYTDEELFEMRRRGDPRPPGVNTPRWMQIKKLQPKHELIAYQMVAGTDRAKICAEFGYTASRLSVIANSPRFKEFIKELQDKLFRHDFKERFNTLGHAAIDTVNEIMIKPTAKDTDRLHAANTILDRALGKPTQHHEHTGSVMRKILEQMDQIRKAAQNGYSEQNSDIINVTPVSSETSGENARDKHDAWVKQKLGRGST